MITERINQPGSVEDSAENLRTDALSGESILSKIHREISVGTGAIADGFAGGLQHAKEHPLQFVGNIAGSVGLVLAARGPGWLTVPATVIGSLGAIGFAKEGATAISASLPAIGDTWGSDKNIAQDRSQLAQSLGPLSFDIAVIGVGALGAGRLAERLNGQTTEIPALLRRESAVPERKLDVTYDSDLAKLHRAASKSVSKVEVVRRIEGNTVIPGSATAFAVTTDGKLMTARHVVDGALDISVIDRRGDSHRASVLGVDRENDLAVLQLTDRSSFRLFKPLMLGNGPEGFLTDGGEDLVGFGYPRRWNKLFASPSGVDEIPQYAMISGRFVVPLHVEPGNSGTPILSKSSEVVGVAVKAPADRTDRGAFAIATPAQRARELLNNVLSSEAAAPSQTTHRQFGGGARYFIGERGLASKEINSLFGDELNGTAPIDALHSKWKHVSVASSDLILKAQYSHSGNHILVEPLAINGTTIPDQATWGDARVKDAALKVILNRRKEPVAMIGSNDPLSILPKMFQNGQTDYLSNLQPIQTLPRR